MLRIPPSTPASSEALPVSSMPLDPRRRPFGGEFTRRVDTGSRAEANTSCHHNLLKVAWYRLCAVRPHSRQ